MTRLSEKRDVEDRNRRRADLLLLVNGFPVALIENKSPTVPEAELETFDQVQHTCTERIPELLKFVQVFAACNARQFTTPDGLPLRFDICRAPGHIQISSY